MSRAPSPLISPPHKACATRRWVLFLHYAFIIWPIDSHSCHYLALHRSILQLDHHKIALLVQKRQASSGSQRQPIPKSLRAGRGEGGDSMTKTTLCSCHRKTDESRPCCYIAHLIFAIAMNDVVDQAKVGGTFNHTLLVKDLLVSSSQ